MVKFIANRIEKAREDSLYAAQDKYRAYFIDTNIYTKYKEQVDNKLTEDGYGDCIVEE